MRACVCCLFVSVCVVSCVCVCGRCVARGLIVDDDDVLVVRSLLIVFVLVFVFIFVFVLVCMWGGSLVTTGVGCVGESPPEVEAY